MINLSLDELVMLYLVVAFGIATLSWLRNVRRRRRDRLREARCEVWCGACAHRFHDTSPTELPRCPHCGRAAERGGLPGV